MKFWDFYIYTDFSTKSDSSFSLFCFTLFFLLLLNTNFLVSFYYALSCISLKFNSFISFNLFNRMRMNFAQFEIEWFFLFMQKCRCSTYLWIINVIQFSEWVNERNKKLNKKFHKWKTENYRCKPFNYIWRHYVYVYQ